MDHGDVPPAISSITPLHPYCGAVYCFFMKKILTQKPNVFSEKAGDLHDLLGIEKDTLNKYLRVGGDSLYKPVKIKKRDGGERQLFVPCDPLKGIQRKILDRILLKAELSSCVYGFSKGKGIIENASYHANNPFLLNLDIEEFFPSVHYERIKQIYRDMGFDEIIADDLCKLTTYRHQLPQGAPTSPFLASLALSNLDKRLVKLSQANHMSYTRYFDDISISGGKRVIELRESIVRIVKEEGYRVNKKTHLFGRGEIKKITGIEVSDGKLSLQHADELITSLDPNNIHDLFRINGGDIERKRRSIAGKISFLKKVDKEKGKIAEKLFSDFY